MMLPVILMIIGAIIFLFGLFLNLTVLFEPVRKVVEIVYKRNDDYASYESGEGKKVLEDQMKLVVSVGQTLAIVGLIIFALGFFMKYVPRGNDSLFSENVENGLLTGDEEKSSVALLREGDKFIAGDGKEYSVYISVSGSEVIMNDVPVSDNNELEQLILKLDRKYEVYLIDDFADAPTFHMVEKLLDDNGIKKVISTDSF